MQLSADDLANASRLIGWAARPRERPGRNEDYQKLVVRYLEDPGFADVCDAVAAGAGIVLHVDATVGVHGVAEADSPWRTPLADVMKRVGNNPQDNAAARRRALVGAILLATAKVAFPQPGHLDDSERVPRVTTAGILDYLDRIAGRLNDDAPDADADDPGAAALWRAWAALRRGRSNALRASMADQQGAVRKVCRILADEGHLQLVSDADGGTWRATPRFRTAVTALVEESDVYAALIQAEAATVADEGAEAADPQEQP